MSSDSSASADSSSVGSAELMAVLFTCVGALLNGTGAVATKTMLQLASPLSLTAARYFVASAFLLTCVFAMSRGGVRRSLQSLRRIPFGTFVFVGFFNQCAVPLTYTASLSYTSASTTSIIFATTPLCTLLAVSVLNKQRIRLRQGIAVTIALAGILTITGGAAHRVNDGGQQWIGYVLALSAAALQAIAFIGMKSVLSRVPAAAATIGWILVAAVFLTPAALLVDGAAVGRLFALRGNSVLTFAYLAILVTGFAPFLWGFGLRTLSPTAIAGFVNLIPVVASTFSVLVLGEPVTLRLVGGGAAVLFGVYLGQARPKPKPAPVRSEPDASANAA